MGLYAWDLSEEELKAGPSQGFPMGRVDFWHPASGGP